MAEWTPEARRVFDAYMGRIADLSAKMSSECTDLLEGLRAHLETECEVLAGAIVTRDHVQRAISSIGTPEQVLSMDSDATDPAQAPRSSQESAVDDLHCAYYRRQMFVAVFGIGVPTVALCFEILTGLMSSLYLNPIPTWFHVLSGLVLLVGILLPHRLFSGPVPSSSNARRHHLVYALNGYAAMLGLVYTIIYLPILPIAAICTLVLGLGLMGFAPLFCTVSAFYHMKLLHRNRGLYGIDKRRAIRYTLLGVMVAVLTVIGLNIAEFVRWQSLRLAVSEDPVRAEQGFRLLRFLHVENYVLKGCYGLDFAPRGPFRAIMGEPVDSTVAQKVYFRLTGKSFNSVLPPRPNRTLLGLVPMMAGGFRDTAEGVGDVEIGGITVAGTVRDLKLESSRIDAVLGGEPAANVPATWAYIEWILEFRNYSQITPLEARAQIMLPQDAVVSRLTLWIDGEEREAAFGRRQQVREAYRDVAVVRRRDPALVTTAGPDRVLLQCFPVSVAGKLRVKIGITAPLVQRDGRLLFRLPYFNERNFVVPANANHNIWIEGAAPFVASSGKLVQEAGADKRFVLRGTLSDSELLMPENATISLQGSMTLPASVEGTLGTQAARMTLELRAPADPPPPLCIVIDGSVCMNDTGVDWASLDQRLSGNARVNVVFAGADLEVWGEVFASPSPRLSEWLAARRFRGGCDPIPALERAFDLASEEPGAAILWIHGPLPVALSPELGFMQRMERQHTAGAAVRLLSLQVISGPNRIVEALATTPGFESVSLLENVDATLTYTLRNVRNDDIRRSFDLNTGGIAKSENDHVVRLAVNDKIGYLLRTSSSGDRNGAAELAVNTRLVTPLTGAVVLEQKVQYDRHNLDPGKAPEAIPGVPEPEEWALLIVAGIAFCWVARWHLRRRRANTV